MRVDVDERLIDLPWELIHDGREFLCLRYAAGRRIMSEHATITPSTSRRLGEQPSALVVANPSGDLEASEIEGRRVAELLSKHGLHVEFRLGKEARKKDFLLAFGAYDLVHYAGHAAYDPVNPDESLLVMSDGEIQAFEMARFIRHPAPSVVFLNACWSAEELRNQNAHSPFVRGLGRTLMFAGVTAFIGYLVPIADDSATLLRPNSTAVSFRAIR